MTDEDARFKKFTDPRNLRDAVIKTGVVQRAFEISMISGAISSYLNNSHIRNHLLLVGNPGQGKTKLRNAFTDVLKRVGVTTKVVAIPNSTPTGYVDEGMVDLKDRMSGKSILFLEDIDKISDSNSDYSFSTSLQDELLNIMDGSLKTNKRGRYLPLCIGMGAFQDISGNGGLVRIIGSRVEGSLGERDSRLYNDCTPEDLVNYGFKSELANRFLITLGLEDLDLDHNSHRANSVFDAILPGYLTSLRGILGRQVELDLDARNLIEDIVSKRPGSGARAYEQVLARVSAYVSVSVDKGGPEYKVKIDENHVREAFKMELKNIPSSEKLSENKVVSIGTELSNSQTPKT